MNCPRCDAGPEKIEAREAERAARCHACGLVFDAERARVRLPGPDAPPSGSRSIALFAPEGLEATETHIGRNTIYRKAVAGKSEVVIIRRWGGTSASALSLFLIPIGLILASVLAYNPSRRSGLKLDAVGLACLIGAALSVVAIAIWRRSSTRIAVEGGRLRITHGPLPWFGNRDLEASSVEQLYCELIPRTRHELADHYRVYALFYGSLTAVELIGDLATATQALFLEETLERALGIQDRPIRSELPFKKTLPKVGRE